MDILSSEELPDIPDADIDTTGIIFNIQRYSIHDGPGIRTTVFLKGCPLRCAWCSNPESQKAMPEVVHRDSSCIQCGTCAETCKRRAITVRKKGIVINRRICNNCGDCINTCISGSLKFYGEKKTAGEVFKEVMKDADFYRSSGGGVTVSGGEPLSQPDFVAALFRICRENDIHTCMETCGLGDGSAFYKILPYTSLVLFDIKFSNPDKHRKWTGRSNGPVLRNLSLVAKSGVKLTVRIPLIPGINDNPDDLLGIAGMVRDIVEEGGAEINLIPYHKFGLGKYQMLDRRCRLKDLQTQSEAFMLETRQFFESQGFECEVEM